MKQVSLVFYASKWYEVYYFSFPSLFLKHNVYVYGEVVSQSVSYDLSSF